MELEGAPACVELEGVFVELEGSPRRRRDIASFASDEPAVSDVNVLELEKIELLEDPDSLMIDV